MFAAHSTFIGIDPTAGQRPITYAALDSGLRLLALGEGDLNEVLAFVGGQSQAIVAINGPQRPSQGLMEHDEVRSRLSPAPRPGRWGGFRVVEYLLRQKHIKCPQTPAREEDAPAWMQRGFALFRRLESMGFQAHPNEGPLRWLEVYPHAAFTVWLERTPFPKQTLEGRLQRQLVLYDHDLKIHDPMEFFEEVTRYRLRHGILPLDKLYTPGELDAMAAAYLAWLASNQPAGLTLLGDPEEGQIALPAEELKTR